MPDAVMHNATTAKTLRNIAVVRRDASHSLRTCIIGRTSATTAFGSMSCAIHLSCSAELRRGLRTPDNHAHRSLGRFRKRPVHLIDGILIKAEVADVTHYSDDGSHLSDETAICLPTALPSGQ